MKHLLSILLACVTLVSSAQSNLPSKRLPKYSTIDYRYDAALKKVLDTLYLRGGSGTGATVAVEQTHTTGATVTVNANTTLLKVNPAMPQASLNIVLPSAPTSRRLVIYFGDAITAGNTAVTSLSFTGPFLVPQPITGEALAGEVIAVEYTPSTGKWIQVAKRESDVLRNRLGNLSMPTPPRTMGNINAVPVGQKFIFDHTSYVFPGQHLAVQGSFSASATVGLTVADSPYFVTLPTVSQSAGLVQVRLPVELPRNVYRIFVLDGGVRSEVKYINQARADAANSPVVYSGCNLSIKGKNLRLGGDREPGIRFVQQGTGTVLRGKFVAAGSHGYKANFRVPSGLVANADYDVYVSNGYGETVSESKLSYTLKAIAPAKDVYGLGVGYSAYFTDALNANVYDVKTDSRLTPKATGNGVADDQPASQNAVNLASAATNGGVVKYPDGTYVFENGLNLKNKVVIKGAGKTKTKFVFGSTAFGPGTGFLDGFSGASNVGFQDLTIDLRNADNGNFLVAWIRNSQNIFFKNVRFLVKKSEWMSLENCKSVALIDCEWDHDANLSQHGPLNISNCEHVVMRRNTSTFVTGVNVTDTRYLFATNNAFSIDFTRPKIGGTAPHSLILEFVANSIIESNKFNSIGSIPLGTNVGGFDINANEAIICEGGGPSPRNLGYGLVASATTTTLTRAAGSWGTTVSTKPILRIIKGKGMGQSRRIVSVANGVATLDSPWSVTPDATSAWSTFDYGLENVAFYNNTFDEEQRLLTLYHAGLLNIDIVNNLARNGGSIDVTTLQVTRDGSGVDQFMPVQNIDIIGNELDSRTDPNHDCSIGIQHIQHVHRNTWGTACVGLRMLGNTISLSTPNRKVAQDELFEPGLNNYGILHELGGGLIDEGIPMILGTIIEGNTGLNCEKVINLSSGSYQTIIINTERINSPLLLNDMAIPGAGHGSVQTIQLNNN